MLWALPASGINSFRNQSFNFPAGFKTGASQCGPPPPKKGLQYIHAGLNTTVNLVIPLVVMSYCYYKIFKEVKDHLSRLDMAEKFCSGSYWYWSINQFIICYLFMCYRWVLPFKWTLVMCPVLMVFNGLYRNLIYGFMRRWTYRSQ